MCPVINSYIATNIVMFQSAARLCTRLYGFSTHDNFTLTRTPDKHLPCNSILIPPELCTQNGARHFEQQSEQHNQQLTFLLLCAELQLILPGV
jgi:hypothetical protein